MANSVPVSIRGEHFQDVPCWPQGIRRKLGECSDHPHRWATSWKILHSTRKWIYSCSAPCTCSFVKHFQTLQKERDMSYSPKSPAYNLSRSFLYIIMIWIFLCMCNSLRPNLQKKICKAYQLPDCKRYCVRFWGWRWWGGCWAGVLGDPEELVVVSLYVTLYV